MKSFFSKFKSERKKGRLDRIFLLLTLLLAVLGTVAIYSAGFAYADFRYDDPLYFAKRQTLWLIIGIFVMALSSLISLETIKKYSLPAFLVSLVLLLLTLVIGFVGNGAQRWIAIGPLTIQPSEITKLTLIIILARYFDKFQSKACNILDKKATFIYGTLIPFAIILIPILLVMLQKHLSCIIILGTIGLIMILLSGAGLKYISAFIAAGAAGVSYIAFFTEYTKDRITVWQNPEAYKLTGGWQTLQGLMAIGSGGLFGKGFGNGELKHCYVSEPANDMIFTIVCEEFGFVGCIVILLLFAALIAEGFKIALRTKDTFSKLLVLGICSKTAVQTLLNVAVVTNSIPNTGISLPFFSYGGSSLIMLFFEMGIVLSASRQIKIQK